MSAPDEDEVYHKNARNMALVLAAIVIVIFAAIFIPPLVNPVREQFAPEASVNSEYGFSLSLALNATNTAPGTRLAFSVWVNNTSDQINNVTAEDNWPVTNLSGAPCYANMPMRVGVMVGYFTESNFSLGVVYPLSSPLSDSNCALASGTAPSFFLFKPLGPEALVRASSGIVQLNISLTVSSNGYVIGGNSQLFTGVMTAVAVDEWGDSVVTHFIANPS
jgi:hypothetical protein